MSITVGPIILLTGEPACLDNTTTSAVHLRDYVRHLAENPVRREQLHSPPFGSASVAIVRDEATCELGPRRRIAPVGRIPHAAWMWLGLGTCISFWIRGSRWGPANLKSRSYWIDISTS